jgi:succinate dehydrogenase / fumarate reductase cytochrome b subunit
MVSGERSADPGFWITASGFWIAVSGLALTGFLIAHLAGVALALLDPAAFEHYAASLHRQAWLPWLEGVLAAVALVHPLLALRRLIANHRARGQVMGPQRSLRQGAWEALAAQAARLVPWSGLLLLAFLVLHLRQLRWQRPLAGGELAAVLAVLASPWSLVLYVVAGASLGLHLLHGGESAVRRMGLLAPSTATPLRLAGRGLALLLGGGFALLPIALVLQAGAFRGAGG